MPSGMNPLQATSHFSMVTQGTLVLSVVAERSSLGLAGQGYKDTDAVSACIGLPQRPLQSLRIVNYLFLRGRISCSRYSRMLRPRS